MASKKKTANLKSPGVAPSLSLPVEGSVKQLPMFPEGDEIVPEVSPPERGDSSKLGSYAGPSLGAAPHVMGAFIYQLMYATLAAARLKIGEEVGVELIDDVDVVGPEGTKHVQVKHEITPVTDLSRGMWKAFAAWSKLARSPKRLEHVSLVLVTTAELRGELPQLLSVGAEGKTVGGIEAGNYILAKLEKSNDEELQGYIDRVRELPSDVLYPFLDRIQLIREPDSPGLEKAIRDALAMHFPEEALEFAAREFRGFIQDIVARATAEKRVGAIIRSEDVREVLLSLQSRYPGSGWRYRHASTTFTEDEREQNKERTFFRQLEAIEARDGVLNKALSDYLRLQKEETDWARHVEIGKEDLNAYREEIFSKWEYFKDDPGDEFVGLNDKVRGMRLCDKLLQSPSPSLGRDPNPRSHVYRGTCHYLADVPKIGWHPKWEEIFGLGKVSEDEES